MKTYINDFFWFGLTNQKITSDAYEVGYNLSSSPLIYGKKASIKEVTRRIKKIFDEENLVHFDGLSCDQKSLDQILNLAEKKRSSVNHMEAEEINNFFSAFQKYGGSLVSFNEIKKRSDLIIFLGDFEESQIQRFLFKVGWNRTKIEKSIFLLGKKKNTILKNSFEFKEPLNLGGQILDFFKNTSVPEKFKRLKKKINLSRYPVMVINSKNGLIFTDQLLKVFAYINNNLRKIRIFRFCGLNNSSGFVNSCISKTGFPGSVSFTDWGVAYNPNDYDAKQQKKVKKTQIFFSNLNQEPKMEIFKKNIFIGHPNKKNKESFDVYIPVKTPGVDTEGIIVRSDGAGVMKLEKKINSQYIEMRQLINQLI